MDLVERLLDRGISTDPDRAIARNRQPGKCCAQRCIEPGQAVMVDLPAPHVAAADARIVEEPPAEPPLRRAA